MSRSFYLCLLRLHPQRFRQATDPIRQFRSFPAFLALASLDKAFYRGVDVHQAHVVLTRLARRASDHLPLVLDLRLKEHHELHPGGWPRTE